MKHKLAAIRSIRHITNRVVHARKRMKVTAIIALFASILASAHIYSTTWVYPNTYLNGIAVGNMRIDAIEPVIHTLLATPYTMSVNNRTYTYTYTDFGIALNPQAVIDELFAPNNLPFPSNIISLMRSLTHPRSIEPQLIFTQDFERFIDQTVYDFSDTTNEVVFSQEDKSLTVIENEEKYRIDAVAFRKLLDERINTPDVPLYPALVKIKNTDSASLEDIAERIKRMFLTPLTVIVDAGGVTKSFTLTERELADIATVTWQQSESTKLVDIHGELVMRILNEHIKKVKLMTKGNIASPKVLKDLEDALVSRFKGHEVDAIKIYYDLGPNSDGTLASKYIEVDISQQKMYLFQSEKLIKEYRVSTGLDYPTPVGEFTILNKTGLGFSNIYSVWMAWWMGFKYSDELHAYFGIHEVPYTLTDTNTKIQPRSSAYVGTPNTGGCVALGVGDAQTVYRFADIGTKVMIYH